ncbi:MAG: hypothetical protein MUP28_06125 [Candidatus Aminicenantes bacterium]|nr:hypothetical protein [Candidatus Aminicenantes bacterium]
MKIWKKPELVVLYRGKPEESVLTHCKHANDPPVTAANLQGDCNDSVTSCGACHSNKEGS